MEKIRVRMAPHLDDFVKEESGIRRVVQAYFKYAEQVGIEFVDKDSHDYDLFAVHAGMVTKYGPNRPIVSHTHGLYWTADYGAANWEWRANANVIGACVYANIVTVPSDWVADTFRRDMRLDPIVIHHGIEWQEFTPGKNEGYVLWNKNRNADVCDPTAVGVLAKRFPKTIFTTTFAPSDTSSNVYEIGLQPHDKMRAILSNAAIYLSTTKETFGIGALEALASGVPVLGWAHGGNLITIEHGINGYMARPGDFDDLEFGLNYCLKFRDTLSVNARETAKKWGWEKPMKDLRKAYDEALK